MIATAVLCVALTATAAPVPKERADAEKVVGTWKLVKSSARPDGLATELVLELTQGGKMTIRQTTDGNTFTSSGEYKVEKGVLTYTIKGPGDFEKTEPLKLKKLTEKELHVVDPDGIQEDFERVVPDKKQD